MQMIKNGLLVLLKGIKKNKTGSTLVEVVVAFAILMLCLGMLVKSSDVSFNLQEKAMRNNEITQAKNDMIYLLKPVAAWGIRTSSQAAIVNEISTGQYNTIYKMNYGTDSDSPLKAGGAVEVNTGIEYRLISDSASVNINNSKEITYSVSTGGITYEIFAVDCGEIKMPFGFDIKGEGPDFDGSTGPGNGNSTPNPTPAGTVTMPGITDKALGNVVSKGESNGDSNDKSNELSEIRSGVLPVHEIHYYDTDDGRVSYAVDRDFVLFILDWTTATVTRLNTREDGNYLKMSEIANMPNQTVSLYTGDILINDIKSYSITGSGRNRRINVTSKTTDSSEYTYYYWRLSAGGINNDPITTEETLYDLLTNEMGDGLGQDLRTLSFVDYDPGTSDPESGKTGDTPGEGPTDEEPGNNGLVVPEDGSGGSNGG